MFHTPAEPSEIRGQVDSIEKTQQILTNLGAKFLSAYEFTDSIFLGSDADLSEEYWRIRHYHKTNWDQKSVNLTHKKIFPERAGRLLKDFYQEYDCVEEALQSVPGTCRKLAAYRRNGLEFRWEDFHVFLEDIKGLPPTVEVVSDLPLMDVKDFMNSIGIQSYFKQSVPGLICTDFSHPNLWKK